MSSPLEAFSGRNARDKLAVGGKGVSVPETGWVPPRHPAEPADVRVHQPSSDLGPLREGPRSIDRGASAVKTRA